MQIISRDEACKTTEILFIQQKNMRDTNILVQLKMNYVWGSIRPADTYFVTIITVNAFLINHNGSKKFKLLIKILPN